MSNLRRIRPLILPKNKEKVNPGNPPSPILLKLSQLRVNDEYQRQLSKDSSRIATVIATQFDWELYHLPVVSPINEVDEVTGLPLYEVMDGQHTVIGAVTNGNIKEVWCWPGRANSNIESRATSFHKLNTQRTAVTPVELFWAQVTAKNEDALDVIEACERAQAKIVKRPKPYGNMMIGETLCAKQLMNLAKAGGVPYVERILKLGVSLRLAPIDAMWIGALEELLFKPHSPLHVSGLPSTVDLQIENAVRRVGVENLKTAAKINYAGEALKDRNAVYYHLAAIIKQEMER